MGSIHPAPSPPCTTVGVWICVYVRGLNSQKPPTCEKKNGNPLIYVLKQADAIVCLRGEYSKHNIAEMCKKECRLQIVQIALETMHR